MGSWAIIREHVGHRARATNLAATAAGDDEETAVEPRGTPNLDARLWHPWLRINRVLRRDAAHSLERR